MAKKRNHLQRRKRLSRRIWKSIRRSSEKSRRTDRSKERTRCTLTQKENQFLLSNITSSLKRHRLRLKLSQMRHRIPLPWKSWKRTTILQLWPTKILTSPRWRIPFRSISRLISRWPAKSWLRCASKRRRDLEEPTIKMMETTLLCKSEEAAAIKMMIINPNQNRNRAKR